MMMSFSKRLAFFSILCCFVGGVAAVPVTIETGGKSKIHEWNVEGVTQFLEDHGYKHDPMVGSNYAVGEKIDRVCKKKYKNTDQQIICSVHCDKSKVDQPDEGTKIIIIHGKIEQPDSILIKEFGEIEKVLDFCDNSESTWPWINLLRETVEDIQFLR